MQRRATKNTRAANADEKRFQSFTKESSCIVCDNPPPSIVHHCMGATYKHNKTLIGHWFVLPLCVTCDDVITQGSRRAFKDKFGFQHGFWSAHSKNYINSHAYVRIPHEITLAIENCNE